MCYHFRRFFNPQKVNNLFQLNSKNIHKKQTLAGILLFIFGEGESYTLAIVTADANLQDNISVETVTLFDGNTDMFVDVVFLTDNFANESYLEIADESGNVIWSQGNENVEGNYNTGDENNCPTDPTEPLENNTEYT